MKECKDCLKSKQKSEFYGVQGECKSCTRLRVQLNYSTNREHYIEYERTRQQDPERRKKKLEYQKVMRAKHGGKYKARHKVSNALRDGRLVKDVCVVCKSKNVEAHHTDYRKPLQVMWVCRKHHMQLENKVSY